MFTWNVKCNSVLNDNDNNSSLLFHSPQEQKKGSEDYNYAPDWIQRYPGQLQPRLQPGVYMILCLANNYRYYGETSNISMRLAGHRRDLRRRKHANENLQKDWTLFGEEFFQFAVLFIGEGWKERETRLEKETQLILDHPGLCYNTYTSMSDRLGELNAFYGRKHTEATKRLIGDLQRGVPKDLLGSAVHIRGCNYPSIADASRRTGHSRKLVRTRVDSPDHPEWYRLSEKPNDYPNGSRGNASPETASNQEKSL